MKTPSKWLKNTLSQLQELVSTERRIGVEILELLWEIERRKAFAEMGYDGLFTFCVKELKFTESQAFQRIQAMRAMKGNSESGHEIKKKIESGTMSVTTVAQVQVFLRQQQAQGVKRTDAEKLELFNQFENKTSQEVKKEIAELKGETLKIKLTLELDAEAEFLWKEFRAKAAFQTRGDDLLGFKILLKEWLAKRDFSPTATKLKQVRLTKIKIPSKHKAAAIIHPPHAQAIRALSPLPSRHIPNELKREILARDQGQCTACGSKYAVTLEHVLPFANGGEHSTANLKLLCRNCNLHQGVKTFGLNAMRR